MADLETPGLKVTMSRHFADWLSQTGGSLALTTYQSGGILLIGTKPGGGLSVFARALERPMGLAVDGSRLAVATKTQIITFVDAGPGHITQDRTGAPPYDAIYIPQLAHFTGDLDAHDLAFDSDGQLVFVNTLFGCLARASVTHSFKALWKPPFLTQLAPGDRCHLNGLAMKDGAPAYVTAVSMTDTVDGWREHRVEGGAVIDVHSNEVACHGLSMPHSPRLDGSGQLHILNAGTGEFGRVNLETGQFEALTFLPGFLRGLAFAEGKAVIGLSEPRENGSFAGLPLQERLEQERRPAQCGIMVVDPASGAVLHWLRLGEPVRELYDVTFIPGRRMVSMVGFRTDEIRRVLSIDSDGPL